jgi:hypothetical protein
LDRSSPTASQDSHGKQINRDGSQLPKRDRLKAANFEDFNDYLSRTQEIGTSTCPDAKVRNELVDCYSEGIHNKLENIIPRRLSINRSV